MADERKEFATIREHDDSIPVMLGGNVAIIFGVCDLLDPALPYEVGQQYITCQPTFISHTGFKSITPSIVSRSSGIPAQALQIEGGDFEENDKSARLKFLINQQQAFSGLVVASVTVTTKGGDAKAPAIWPDTENPDYLPARGYWKSATETFTVKIIVCGEEAPWTAGVRYLYAVVDEFFTHSFQISTRVPRPMHNMCYTRSITSNTPHTEPYWFCSQPIIAPILTPDGRSMGLNTMVPGNACESTGLDDCNSWDDNSPVTISGYPTVPGVYCIDILASCYGLPGVWFRDWQGIQDYPIPVIVEVLARRFYAGDAVVAKPMDRALEAVYVSGFPVTVGYNSNGGYRATKIPSYESQEDDYAEYRTTRPYLASYASVPAPDAELVIEHHENKWRIVRKTPEEDFVIAEVDDGAPQGGYATEPPTEWKDAKDGAGETLAEPLCLLRGDFYAKKADDEFLGFWDAQGRLNGACYYRQCAAKAESDVELDFPGGWWLWSTVREAEGEKLRTWHLGRALGSAKYSSKEGKDGNFPPPPVWTNPDNADDTAVLALAERDAYAVAAYATPRKLGESGLDVCDTAKAQTDGGFPVTVATAVMKPDTNTVAGRSVAVRGTAVAGRMTRYFPRHWDFVPFPFDDGAWQCSASVRRVVRETYVAHSQSDAYTGHGECADTLEKPYKEYVEGTHNTAVSDESISATETWEHGFDAVDLCRAVDNRVDWLGAYTPDSGGSITVDYEREADTVTKTGNKVIMSSHSDYSMRPATVSGSARVVFTPYSGREANDGAHTLRWHGAYEAHAWREDIIDCETTTRAWNEETEEYDETTTESTTSSGIAMGGDFALRGINPETLCAGREIGCGIAVNGGEESRYATESWTHSYSLYWMEGEVTANGGTLKTAKAIEITETATASVVFSSGHEEWTGLLSGENAPRPSANTASGTKRVVHSWHRKRYTYDPSDLPYEGHPGFRVISVEEDDGDSTDTETAIEEWEEPQTPAPKYEAPGDKGGATLTYAVAVTQSSSNRRATTETRGGIA